MDLITEARIEKINQLSQAVYESSRRTKEIDATRVKSAFLGLSPGQIAKYSYSDAIRSALQSVLHNKRFDGFEAECTREINKNLDEFNSPGEILVPSDVFYRDLGTGTGRAGGYLVGNSVGLFAQLYARTPIFLLGAQYIPDQIGNLTWNKQVSGSSATWVAPGIPVPEVSPTGVQVSSTPKTCLAFSMLSQQMAVQGGPAVEASVLDLLTRDMSVALNGAALNGAGGAVPLGALNTPGIGNVASGAIDYAKICEFQSDVAGSNAVLNPAKLGYVCHPTVASLLKSRQRFTGSDSPLWKGNVTQGEVEGTTAISTTLMPAATVLYGDFSSLFIVSWSGLRLEVNPYQAFNTAQVGVRSILMVDVVVPYPLAFSAANGVS